MCIDLAQFFEGMMFVISRNDIINLEKQRKRFHPIQEQTNRRIINIDNEISNQYTVSNAIFTFHF